MLITFDYILSSKFLGGRDYMLYLVFLLLFLKIYSIELSTHLSVTISNSLLWIFDHFFLLLTLGIDYYFLFFLDSLLTSFFIIHLSLWTLLCLLIWLHFLFPCLKCGGSSSQTHHTSKKSCFIGAVVKIRWIKGCPWLKELIAQWRNSSRPMYKV